MKWWRVGVPPLALLQLLLALPSHAQPLLPAVPGACVNRYGNSGCAANLYAQLLCDTVGSATTIQQLEPRLQSAFEQAGINFVGLTAEAIETAAVRRYTPMLCSLKNRQIQELFQPRSSRLSDLGQAG
jgi:hypothetical protein